jgi:hypothetical protein
LSKGDIESPREGQWLAQGKHTTAALHLEVMD